MYSRYVFFSSDIASRVWPILAASLLTFANVSHFLMMRHRIFYFFCPKTAKAVCDACNAKKSSQRKNDGLGETNKPKVCNANVKRFFIWSRCNSRFSVQISQISVGYLYGGITKNAVFRRLCQRDFTRDSLFSVPKSARKKVCERNPQAL